MMALFYYQDQTALSKCFVIIFIFVFSLGSKETVGKISQTSEAANNISWSC